MDASLCNTNLTTAALNSLLLPDARGQREPLLELLGHEAAPALRLGLVLGQHDEHVAVRLDGELLGPELPHVELDLELLVVVGHLRLGRQLLQRKATRGVLESS